ncbi:MAG: hypothetical protein ACRDJN_26185 [Chloroflexota bacterium]
MDLELGTVERATNLTCLVRFIGESRLVDVHYSKAILSNFILIQPRHVVVIDRSRTPMEVVWRAGTMATVVAVDGGTITYTVGAAGGPLRTANTVPLRDARPAEERKAPIQRGDEVVLGPGPEKGVPAIIDTAVDGRPAHPERLRATFPNILAAIQPKP